MSSQFSSCQVCGLQCSSEDLDAHEISCLQRFQDELDIEKFDDINLENEGDEQESNPKDSSNPEGFTIKNNNPRDNDDESDTSEIKATTTSDMCAYPPPVKHIESTGRHSSDTKNKPTSSYGTSKTSKYSPDLKTQSRKKKRDLFPPTKKYRYYPITCEYCGNRFQPGELKTHQQKYHSEQSTSGGVSYTDYDSSKSKDTPRSKSVGGVPSCLQNCYICGKLYGSKSIKIHEPQCLEKWKIQNGQLPPHMRAPEPQKPAPILTGTSTNEYDLPEYDQAAEAAFQSHLRSLVPCTHCERTFSPDRILKHESCCIERPRTRSCITPKGGEIPR